MKPPPTNHTCSYWVTIYPHGLSLLVLSVFSVLPVWQVLVVSHWCLHLHLPSEGWAWASWHMSAIQLASLQSACVHSLPSASCWASAMSLPHNWYRPCFQIAHHLKYKFYWCLENLISFQQLHDQFFFLSPGKKCFNFCFISVMTNNLQVYFLFLKIQS